MQKHAPSHLRRKLTLALVCFIFWGATLGAAYLWRGWPDRADEWLGPDAVWKRVEWATRVADRMGRQIDARQLAQASLGPLLQDSTAQQIERAADGPQALALLLLAPEFQRR